MEEAEKKINIAITANRDLHPEDLPIIDAKMKELVNNPKVKGIIFGGARGGDTVSLLSALTHRYPKTDPKFLVVVPETLRKQPESTWTASRRADGLIELKNKITAADGFYSFKIRNAYMVDRAHEVVAFWDNKSKSGTYSCINYARKLGRPITIVTIRGTDGKQSSVA